MAIPSDRFDSGYFIGLWSIIVRYKQDAKYEARVVQNLELNYLILLERKLLKRKTLWFSHESRTSVTGQRLLSFSLERGSVYDRQNGLHLGSGWTTKLIPYLVARWSL